MDNKLTMADFNILKDDIKHDLTCYYNMINLTAWTQLSKKYASVEDYINILYHYRFNTNYSATRISKILGEKSQSNVSNIFGYLGWEYCFDGSFEEVCAAHEDYYKKTCEIIEKNLALLNEPDFNMEFDKYFYRYKKEKLHKKCQDRFGFSNLMDCLKTFYLLIKRTDLSTSQIALYYQVHIRALQKFLKKYELNRSKEDGNIIATAIGRKNYGKMRRNSWLATVDFRNKTGNAGTINENFCRSLLCAMLPSFLPPGRYESLVCVNHPCLVDAKEVDIPVIVINLENQRLFKFSVEFNGEVFHKDDTKKIEKLESKGWTYIPIWYVGLNTQRQREFGEIEEQCRACCFKIKESVMKTS